MHNHLNRTKDLIRAIVGLLVAGIEANEVMVAVGIAEIEVAVGIEVLVDLQAADLVDLQAADLVDLQAADLVDLQAADLVDLQAVDLVVLLAAAIEVLAGSGADSTQWKCSNG
jgi:hypothetical protein